METVAASAGDTITVQWDQSTHPGPITHFLYGPVDGSAASATGVGAGWVKIDELDYEGGQWANEIMSAADMKHSFQLPANLASGEYLVSQPQPSPAQPSPAQPSPAQSLPSYSTNYRKPPLRLFSLLKGGKLNYFFPL